jgi:hypothetical protein
MKEVTEHNPPKSHLNEGDVMQENTKPMDAPLAPLPGSGSLSGIPSVQTKYPVPSRQRISTGVGQEGEKSLGTEKGKEDQLKLRGLLKKKVENGMR